MALDVLTMGRTLVDLYPTQDGPLEQVATFEKAVGGSPTNVAIAASRLGHRSGVVSRVGDDAFGRFARSSLQQSGVDVSQVLTVLRGVTPVAICEVSPPDSFPLTIYRPAPPVDVAIDSAELDVPAIRDARIFWATLSGLSAEPSRTAHLAGFRSRPSTSHSVLDLDYRPAFWSSEAEATAAARVALPHATIVVGNLDECRIVTGANGPDAAADALLATGARMVIVKLGGDGVMGVTAEDRLTVAPIPVTVANGLGSGDAFGGALCHALLSGWALDRSLSFANAAGAFVASRRGCSTAMPTVEEIEELAGQ
jgi:5-dehydro-2-deoxygluconokinase